MSRAAEAGLRKAVRKAKAWLRENAKAIESPNRYVERHGLPQAMYRVF